MAKIERSEDIEAWKRSRVLTKKVYDCTKQRGFEKNFGLKDQIRRASVSTMSNIAEGFDCESKTEFGRFLGIARRSTVEVQSLLYVALDLNYINNAEFAEHYEQARKTKALIGGFKNSLIRRST